MPNRRYLQALLCYLLIPAVMFAGAAVFRLIDPEMARGHADYARDFRLLELARMGALAATAGLALILWIAVCHLVLESRQRSPRWLLLAAAGPLGFIVIAMLADRAPAPDDRYQQLIRNLKIYWRITLEIAVFVASWNLAYEFVALKRDWMISYESHSTGTPAAAIIAQQSASSGMWAFGEGLQVCYLIVLIYLLWPVLFNLAARYITPRPPSAGSSRHSG